MYLSRRKHCGDWSFAVPPPSILPSISDCFVDLATAHHRIPSVLKSTSAREVLKLAPRETNISSIRTPSGREKFQRPLPPSTTLKAKHARQIYTNGENIFRSKSRNVLYLDIKTASKLRKLQKTFHQYLNMFIHVETSSLFIVSDPLYNGS